LGPVSNADGGPPPGWYDDPEFPGRPRWWDGQRWAPADAPPAPPALHGAAPVPAAAADLARERATGGRAKVAVWVGLVAFFANHVFTVAIYRDLVPRLNRMFEDLSAGRQPSTAESVTLVNPLVALGSQVVSLLSLAVVVVYLVWFHRAVRNAGNLGLRLRFSPAWAVAGFLIPFASWVMPFLSTQDLFPPGHRGRRLIAPWWAAWLLGNYGASFALVVGSGIDAAVYISLTVSAVALAIAAVLAGRIVDAAGRAHVEVARARGLVAPDFDPGVAPAAPAADVPDPWSRAAGR
jgi:hypothetical protein